MGWSSGGDVMDGIIKAVRKHVDPEDAQTLRRLRPGQTVRLGIGGGSVEVRRVASGSSYGPSVGMDKIASTDELQAELRKLLAYAQTHQPSRTVLARDLTSLTLRVAGKIPPQFLENIQKKKDEAKDKDDDSDED